MFLGNIETYKNFDWEQKAVENPFTKLPIPKNKNAFTRR